MYECVNGKPKQQSLKTTDWDQAQRIIAGLESQRGKGPTILEACNAMMTDMAAREISLATRKKYRQLMDRLVPFCDQRSIRVADFSVQHAREFRAGWGVSPISANKMLERLRALFKFCAESGWCKANPALALKRAKETQPPTMSFSPVELAKIMSAIDAHCDGKTGARRLWAERLRALVLVMRWSALRISDAVMLRPEQIQGDCIVLRQAKTDIAVRIPVPPIVHQALDRCGVTDGFYFGGMGGKIETRTGDVRRNLRDLFQRAGVPDGHAHRFRDTRAIELLNAGVDLKTVSEILGHQHIEITERHYLPFVKERQERIEDAVRKTWQILDKVFDVATMKAVGNA